MTVNNGEIRVYDITDPAQAIDAQRARVAHVLKQVADQHPVPPASHLNANADIDAVLYEAYLKDATSHALVALRYLTITNKFHPVPAIVRADLRRAVAGLRRLREIRERKYYGA